MCVCPNVRMSVCPRGCACVFAHLVLYAYIGVCSCLCFTLPSAKRETTRRRDRDVACCRYPSAWSVAGAWNTACVNLGFSLCAVLTGMAGLCRHHGYQQSPLDAVLHPWRRPRSH